LTFSGDVIDSPQDNLESVAYQEEIKSEAMFDSDAAHEVPQQASSVKNVF